MALLLLLIRWHAHVPYKGGLLGDDLIIRIIRLVVARNKTSGGVAALDMI